MQGLLLEDLQHIISIKSSEVDQFSSSLALSLKDILTLIQHSGSIQNIAIFGEEQFSIISSVVFYRNRLGFMKMNEKHKNLLQKILDIVF
jgi:hypothetical protein